MDSLENSVETGETSKHIFKVCTSFLKYNSSGTKIQYKYNINSNP